MRERMKAVFTACQSDGAGFEDGRQRSGLFKELPDRKLYPDYSEVSPCHLAFVSSLSLTHGTTS
jgi:hypothetical protein